MLRIHGELMVLILTFVATAPTGFAQGPGSMPRPAAPAKDSGRNTNANDTAPSTETVARGQVAMADGSVPQGLVQIFMIGAGAEKFIAVADSKGRFSFNPGVLSANCAKGCELRAVLEGYKSDAKPLADVSQTGSTKLGKILLQPLSSDTNGLTSATTAQASKGAKKAYEKGLDEAAKQAWAEAKASLVKATSGYGDYSEAWLSLGILQQSEGDREGALKSFAESARADGKFAAPLIFIAALDSLKGDWQATVEHSQKALDLNPSAFPHAYELNALGNLNLKKVDAVEKSATEGLKIDTEHRYPELEYMLGVALSAKRETEAATKHLQAYLDQSPDGPNAAQAKKVLTELRASH